MSKKTIKILTILLTVLGIVMVLSSSVFALEPGDINGSGATATEATNEIKSLGNQIFNIIQTVGIVLAVIILAVLGIKYMMGSAEEKADYKKSMIPYLIGAAILFLAPTIANTVYKFFVN